MALARYDPTATHFQSVGTATAHRFGDHTHRQALQLRQNVAPKVHTIQRSIVAPRSKGPALLGGSAGSAALRFGRACRIVTGCTHSCDLGWTPDAERGCHGAPLCFHLIGEALRPSKTRPASIGSC